MEPSGGLSSGFSVKMSIRKNHRSNNSPSSSNKKKVSFHPSVSPSELSATSNIINNNNVTNAETSSESTLDRNDKDNTIDDENVLRVPLPQFPNGSLLDVLNSMNYQKDEDPDLRNRNNNDNKSSSSSNSNITLPYLSIAGCYESYEIIKHTEFRSFWRSWLSKTQVVRFARFINHLREYMRKELNNQINEDHRIGFELNTSDEMALRYSLDVDRSGGAVCALRLDRILKRFNSSLNLQDTIKRLCEYKGLVILPYCKSVELLPSEEPNALAALSNVLVVDTISLQLGSSLRNSTSTTTTTTSSLTPGLTLVTGKSGNGKSQRVLRKVTDIFQKELDNVRSLRARGISSRAISVPDFLWIDCRGVLSKYGLLSRIASEIGIRGGTVTDIEVQFNKFLEGISPRSVLVLDHVSPQIIVALVALFKNVDKKRSNNSINTSSLLWNHIRIVIVCDEKYSDQVLDGLKDLPEVDNGTAVIQIDRCKVPDLSLVAGAEVIHRHLLETGVAPKKALFRNEAIIRKAQAMIEGNRTPSHSELVAAKARELAEVASGIVTNTLSAEIETFAPARVFVMAATIACESALRGLGLCMPNMNTSSGSSSSSSGSSSSNSSSLSGEAEEAQCIWTLLTPSERALALMLQPLEREGSSIAQSTSSISTSASSPIFDLGLALHISASTWVQAQAILRQRHENNDKDVEGKNESGVKSADDYMESVMLKSVKALGPLHDNPTAEAALNESFSILLDYLHPLSYTARPPRGLTKSSSRTALASSVEAVGSDEDDDDDDDTEMDEVDDSIEAGGTSLNDWKAGVVRRKSIVTFAKAWHGLCRLKWICATDIGAEQSVSAQLTHSYFISYSVTNCRTWIDFNKGLTASSNNTGDNSDMALVASLPAALNPFLRKHTKSKADSSINLNRWQSSVVCLAWRAYYRTIANLMVYMDIHLAGGGFHHCCIDGLGAPLEEIAWDVRSSGVTRAVLDLIDRNRVHIDRLLGCLATRAQQGSSKGMTKRRKSQSASLSVPPVATPTYAHPIPTESYLQNISRHLTGCITTIIFARYTSNQSVPIVKGLYESLGPLKATAKGVTTMGYADVVSPSLSFFTFTSDVSIFEVQTDMTSTTDSINVSNNNMTVSDLQKRIIATSDYGLFMVRIGRLDKGEELCRRALDQAQALAERASILFEEERNQQLSGDLAPEEANTSSRKSKKRVNKSQKGSNEDLERRLYALLLGIQACTRLTVLCMGSLSQIMWLRCRLENINASTTLESQQNSFQQVRLLLEQTLFTLDVQEQLLRDYDMKAVQKYIDKIASVGSEGGEGLSEYQPKQRIYTSIDASAEFSGLTSARCLVADIYTRLGSVLHVLADFNGGSRSVYAVKAKVAFEDSVRFCRRTLGSGMSAKEADCLYRLALLLLGMNQPAPAVQAFTLASSVYGRVYSSATNSLAAAAGGIAASLYALDNIRKEGGFWAAINRVELAKDYCAEAVSYYEEALSLYHVTLPFSHLSLNSARTDLARILTDRNSADTLSDSTYSKGVSLYSLIIENLCKRLKIYRESDLEEMDLDNGHQLTLSMLERVTETNFMNRILITDRRNKTSSVATSPSSSSSSSFIPTSSSDIAQGTLTLMNEPYILWEIAARCTELASLHAKAGHFAESVDTYVISLKIFRREREMVLSGTAESRVKVPGAGSASLISSQIDSQIADVNAASDNKSKTEGRRRYKISDTQEVEEVADTKGSMVRDTDDADAGDTDAEIEGEGKREDGTKRKKKQMKPQVKPEGTTSSMSSDTDINSNISTSFVDNRADTRIAQTLLALGQQEANLGASLVGFNLNASSGAFTAAMGHIREAAQLFRSLFRSDYHPVIILCLRCIASIHSAQGRHRTARSVYNKILELYRESGMAVSKEYADILKSMAAQLRAGTHDEQLESQVLLQQALKIYKDFLGNDHIEVAHTFHQLASTYYDIEDYDTAEPLFLEALSIYRRTDAVDINSPLHNAEQAARIRQYVHRLSDRYPLSLADGGPHSEQQDLSIATKAIPDILNCLASMSHYNMDYDGAKGLYTEALRMYLKLYGDINPSVAKVINNLATLMDDKGDVNDAQELYERALYVLQQVYGRRHRQVVVTMENLANLLISKGDEDSLEEAKVLLSAVHEIEDELDETEEQDAIYDGIPEEEEEPTGLAHRMLSLVTEPIGEDDPYCVIM